MTNLPKEELLPYINGSWDYQNDNYRVEKNYSPLDGKLVCTYRIYEDDRTVDYICNTSYSAYEKWKVTSKIEKIEYINLLIKNIIKYKKELISTITKDTGIVKLRAEEEVKHAISLLENTIHLKYIDEPYNISIDGITNSIEKVPYGVVIWIMSWNSPLSGLCKIIYPLLTGNSIILKVSQNMPLCAYLFSKIIHECQFPKGLINIVWDDNGHLTQKLVKNRWIGKIAFTGSNAIGRSILTESLKQHLRPSFMETGGTGIQIIDEESDNIENIFPHLFWGALTLNGQVCCAGTIILVHQSKYKDVIQEFANTLSLIDIKEHLGPLISEQHLIKIENQFKELQSKNYKYLNLEIEKPSDGYYYTPKILLHNDLNNADIPFDVFGPLITIIKYSERNQIIDKLRCIENGLAISIYTTDDEWFNFAKNHLDFGTIWRNGYYQSNEISPFGGMKSSGYGREKGIFGFSEFTQFKNVAVNNV